MLVASGCEACGKPDASAADIKVDSKTAETGAVVIKSVERIYADGKHNAWPDITKWRGHYYIVFSSGSGHTEFDHVAVILRSSDLKNWKVAYKTAFTVGDSKLLALPDKLMVYYVYYHNPTSKEGYVESRCFYTTDGKKWTEPRRVHKRGHNFWRPKIHNGWIYIASDTLIQPDGTMPEEAQEGGDKRLRRVLLLRSADGLEWSEVSTITRGETETSIHFRPDGELWAICRSETFARAKPPYKQWHRKPHMPGSGFGGPALVEVDGNVYAGGRFYGLPAVDGKRQYANALWKYEPELDNFKVLAILPKAGYYDSGYPGFLTVGKDLYMVYYSSHFYEEGRHPSHADIFLAKLNLQKP